MVGALSTFGVDGIDTTIPFLRFLIDQPDFQNGETHVRWIEDLISSAPNGLHQLV
jgi:biotin carboxylase